jgi:hypothetical protein
MSLAIFHWRLIHTVFRFSIPYNRKRSPPTPLPVGSIKPKAAFTAIAASTAVPPFFKYPNQFGSQVADLKPPFHFPLLLTVAKFLP